MALSRLVLAILLLLASNAHVSAQKSALSSDKNGQRVSMIDLIANPNRYDGQLVQVSGVFSFGSENNAIWFGEESRTFKATENALWVNIKGADYEDAKKYDGKHGALAGTFHKKKCSGHMCLFAGELVSGDL